ncbi:LuxR C-terminal-related transcriptional regulator, partial [Gordonia soli]
ARLALAAGDVDGAAAVADRHLEGASVEDADVPPWIALAADIAGVRGHHTHAADLHRWLGPTRTDDALGAVAALLGVGDRESAAAFVATDATRPPIGVRARRAPAVRGLSASLDDPTAALDDVVRGLSAGDVRRPAPATYAPLLAAVSLSLQTATPTAHLMASTVRSSTADPTESWIALRAGDLETAGRRCPAEPVGAADRFRTLAIRLGLARRAGDVGAMTALWLQAPSVLAAVEVDLYSLAHLAEYRVVAARLGQTAQIDRRIAAVDELLTGLGDPVAWSADWRFAEVVSAIAARDSGAAAVGCERLSRLATSAGPATDLARAAEVWTRIADAQPVPTSDVDAAVDGLRRAGRAWEAARLAGEAALRSDDSRTAAALLHTARAVAEERRDAVDTAGPLTEREAEVARELLAGFTYREIGERLFISAKTVEHHVARIRRRLDAGSRSELLSALRAAGYR